MDDDVWALIIKALRIFTKRQEKGVSLNTPKHESMRDSLQEAEDKHWINAMYLDAFHRFRPHR